jgi:hypothetical protein
MIGRDSLKFQDFLRVVMMRTSHLAPLKAGYAVGYAAALMWLVVRIRRMPEIECLDLRLPRRSHCFGSSDLDLRAETRELSALDFFSLSDRLADVLLPSQTWRAVFDLDLFPRREFELQERLEDFSSVGRWIRLCGRQQSGNIHDGGRPRHLGKVLSDYDFIGRELFEGALDLHRTRFVCKKTMDIHERGKAYPLQGVSVPNEVAAQVVRAAFGPAIKGHVYRSSFENITRAHAFALAEASAICHSYDDCGSRCDLSDFTFAESVAPETLRQAVQSCAPGISQLCESLSGSIRSAVLAAVPGTNYEYRIYLIVRDELSLEAHLELCRALRELFSRASSVKIRSDYLRLRPPMVLTPVLWRTMHRWYNSLRPVEEYYFLIRHGVVLWGDDMRDDLREPSRADIVRSALLAVADLRNCIWAAIHLQQSRRLADLIIGRVPTLWLLFAKSLIATSVGEAVSSCSEHSFPHLTHLRALHMSVAGLLPRDLPPTTDAIWERGIRSLTDWLDGLTEMAIREPV